MSIANQTDIRNEIHDEYRSHRTTAHSGQGGEIARRLCALAAELGYPVEVMESDASTLRWPPGIKVSDRVYTDTPYILPAHTHAVIARGHEGDTESVAALLDHGAERVYLIASARRAQSVIESATELMHDPSRLTRLSTPAGLDLGGNSSNEIALSILAEIQMRHHNATGQILDNLREQRAVQAGSIQQDEDCPGKRV